MNSLWCNSVLEAGVGWRLIAKEFRQNFIVYISPVIFFLPIVILSLITGKPLLFGTKATIVALIIAFIYAIIYGLQGFAGETDRKTIDFLLSRPISPTLLIVVKFTINLAVYLFWLLVITQRVVFNWSILHLPKGIDGTVIVFVFPIIMSMGFFAGLIVRGAERLVITVGMTALMAGGCYFLWNQAFLLMAANYYWFDIPPHIVILVSRWIPGVLLFVSLATPLVLSLWFIRGRYSFYKFKPIRRLVSAWAAIALVIWLAVIFIGPTIWPFYQEPRSGDWHPQSGVVIAGSFFRKNYPSSILYLGRIGGKPHEIYRGSRIHSPRWSPDGKSIAFVDGPWIKIWQKTGVKTITQGNFPVWSHDGNFLAFVRNPDKRQQYKGVYVADIAKKSVKYLYSSPKLEVLGLTWDSLRNRLYILHEQKKEGYLDAINLKSLKSDRIKIATSVVFFLQSPTLTIGPNGKVLLGMSYEHQTHVKLLNPGGKEFLPLDDSQAKGIDELSQTILSPKGDGYLVPRMDGAYDYKGFIPPHHHHHGDDDEHEHIH